MFLKANQGSLPNRRAIFFGISAITFAKLKMMCKVILYCRHRNGLGILGKDFTQKFNYNSKLENGIM